MRKVMCLWSLRSIDMICGMDTKVFKTAPVILTGSKVGGYWSGTTQKLCVHVLPPLMHCGNPAMSSRAKILILAYSRTGLILLLHIRIFGGSLSNFHLIVFKLLFLRSFYCATRVETQGLWTHPTSSSGRISPFPKDLESSQKRAWCCDTVIYKG